MKPPKNFAREGKGRIWEGNGEKWTEKLLGLMRGKMGKGRAYKNEILIV